MRKIVIAVDIGASSGRLIAGSYENGKISIDEIHRFINSMVYENGHYYWDIDSLYNEILNGLKKHNKEFGNIESVGVDTWAVDYVLVDKDGTRIAPVFAYRDHRTDETMEKVFAKIKPERIYEKTGIQFQQFNTIYQLYEHICERPDDFKDADKLLMIPDYINYLLSGKKGVEFTNATSTQLLNIKDKEWDKDLLKGIGIDISTFPDIIEPGTILGEMQSQACAETGFEKVKIIAPATHDTGSAVAAVPAVSDDFIYISSGTWSLMGIETKAPISTKLAAQYNFTNEGGVFDTYRVLKNIMGLWMLQEIKRLLPEDIGFTKLTELAEQSEPFKCLINPNDSRFLNPEDMISEIKSYCQETEQYVPETTGELCRCVFESLAFLYRQTIMEIKELRAADYNKIYIIGGGAKNKLLNQLCADFTECDVYAGPYEATAIGNIAMQLIALGELQDIKSARKAIGDSFEVKVYKPAYEEKIEQNWKKFRRLIDGKQN